MTGPHGDHTTARAKMAVLTTTSPEVLLSTSPTRRQVLCGLMAALAAPAGVSVLSSCSSPAPAGPAPGAPPAGVPLAQVPVGGGVLVQGATGPVLVVQPAAGTVKAFDAVCPHQGQTVDPPVGGTIQCPAHLSRFDATTGAVTKGPATTGLAEVPTRVVDGTVTLV